MKLSSIIKNVLILSYFFNSVRATRENGRVMENQLKLQENETVTTETSGDDSGSKKRKLYETFNNYKDNLLDGVNCSGMSKREKRRLLKQLQWQKRKPQKRANEKEKLKQKKIHARLNNISLGPSRKMLKCSTMAASNCKIRVAIDFSFDHLMNNRDLGKCLKQLNHCYSLNRRAANPMQFYVTNFKGESEKEMSKNVGYKNWDINFFEQSYLEMFDKNELVYLTSESNNVVTELDETKVYIIGGLVDHNMHKGLCHQTAEQKGVAHAQLPIGEFIEMKSRRVLTIDHVFEIILNVSGGMTWKESFLKVLPQRKGAMEKEPTVVDEEIKQALDVRIETNQDCDVKDE